MAGRSLAAVAEVLRRAGLLTGVRAPEDLLVSGVSHDSRSVDEGDLFLAWKGTAFDGHLFLEDARDRGAGAAVVERFLPVDLPQLRVGDGRRAAAIVAHELLGRPGDRLRVVAVTGTNGKTTVSFLLRHLLAALGRTAAVGTVGVVGPDGRLGPDTSGLTTPGPVDLVRTLTGLADAGVTTVVLEASSHALEQRRLDGVGVDLACFTNLSQDHLDYHGTLEAYFRSKARLVELLRGEESTVVANGDDPAWDSLPHIPARLLVTSVTGLRSREGSGPGARQILPVLEVDRVRLHGAGSEFRVRWGSEEAEARLPLLGEFNVENAAVALGAAVASGIPLEEAAELLATAPAPPGRMELAAESPVPVILDFAHTPDALERTLRTLAPLHEGRLILVFGAGGDRDREKRPEMGRVAVEGADVVIVTSDNPRTEDPESILDAIEGGMGGAPHFRVADRREAIETALRMAAPGDAVLLAGKGHETYQEVGTDRLPFDERVVVRDIVRELLGGVRNGPPHEAPGPVA
jgi:UDP-N-acetylmuramoyl-L-alanyl-D-glutamate--2,6-diaminopimelate ligase